MSTSSDSGPPGDGGSIPPTPCPSDSELAAVPTLPHVAAHVPECGACQAKRSRSSRTWHSEAGAHRTEDSNGWVPAPKGDSHPGIDLLCARRLDPEVERHLKHCPRCRIDRELLGVVDEDDAGAEVPPIGTTPTAAHVHLPQTPGSARHYLGCGPRGLVFSELCARFDRQVAVKVVQGCDLARLSATNDAVRRAQHPNLEPFLEIAAVDGALELRRRLVKGNFAQAAFNARPPKLLQWFGRIASALAALHEQGGAHGGICSENVRIQMGQVHVVDAGLTPATPADDWFALGELLATHAPQLAEGPQTDPLGLPALIAGMRDPDPKRRPTGAQILAGLVLQGMPKGLDGTRFTFLRKLDDGGMGEVLLVWDPIAQREVALKRVKMEQSASPGTLDRFVEEARVAGKLQHPNILPVYELGEDSVGMPFFTMKLVAGQNLDQVLGKVRQGNAPDWPLARRLEAFLKLCDAVAYAHREGWLHLDLKPRNVMVGEFGELYLFDWGIARLRPQPGHAVQLGTIGNTRRYAPPEQIAAGEPGTDKERETRIRALGPWSDVHALGVTLRELLVGIADGPAAAADAWPATVPGELRAIVTKATQRDPALRYPDVVSLRADVDQWLTGAHVGAYPYSRPERFQRWVRPHAFRILLGGVALLVLGSVGWFGALGWQEAERAQHAKVVEEARRTVWQARASLDHGDLVEAVRASAAAIARADDAGEWLPEGRALLAEVSRRPYLRRVTECAALGTVVTCAGPTGTIDWTVGGIPGSAAPPLQVGFDGRSVWVERDGVQVASASTSRRAWSEAGVLRWESRPTAYDIEQAWPCGPGVVAKAGDLLLAWDPDTGPEPVQVTVSADPTTPPVCTPRGDLVAVGRGNEIDVRSTATLFGDVPHEHLGVVRIAWSDDGALLASWGTDGALRLWGRESKGGPWLAGDLARVPIGGDVSALAFVPGTRLLAIAGSRAELWDAALASRDRLGTKIPSVALRWAAGAPFVGIADERGVGAVWDARTGRSSDELRVKGTEVVAVLPSVDGTDAVVLTEDGVVRGMELGVRGGKRRWMVEEPGFTAVARAGDLVYAAGRDHRVRVWHAADGADAGGWDVEDEVARIEVLAGSATAILVDPDGRVILRDAQTGRMVRSLGLASALAVDPAGRAAVLVREGGSVDLVLPVGPPEAVVVDVEVRAVAVHRDAETGLVRVAVADEASGVTVLERVGDGGSAAWREVGRAVLTAPGASELAFSADGRTLALAGQGDVALWDTAAFGGTGEALVAEVEARFGAEVTP